MKITIDIDKNLIIERLERYLRKAISFSYRWLTEEGEVLGYILGSMHFMISILIFMLVILSHTLYPYFWLQVGVFVSLLLIWIQHVVLQVCISIVAEKNLTNNESPFHKLLEDIFGINSTEFSSYLVTAETIALACFALELISRVSNYLQFSEL